MPSFKIVTFAIFAALTLFALLAVYFAGLTPAISLDFTFTPAQVQGLLASYNEVDVARHIWGTRVLDTVFPLAYALAACLAIWRYFQGTMRIVLCTFVVAGMAMDFWENSLNLRLLAGEAGLARMHVTVTWLKFCLLLPAMGWALSRWIREVLGR